MKRPVDQTNRRRSAVVDTEARNRLDALEARMFRLDKILNAKGIAPEMTQNEIEHVIARNRKLASLDEDFEEVRDFRTGDSFDFSQLAQLEKAQQQVRDLEAERDDFKRRNEINEDLAAKRMAYIHEVEKERDAWKLDCEVARQAITARDRDIEAHERGLAATNKALNTQRELNEFQANVLVRSLIAVDAYNSALRSAHAVAARSGQAVNWLDLEHKLVSVLKDHHGTWLEANATLQKWKRCECKIEMATFREIGEPCKHCHNIIFSTGRL